MIVGRDSSKKNKPGRIRFIGQLTSIAEALVAIQTVIVGLEVLQVFLGPEDLGLLISRQVSLITRVTVLAFIMFFWFFYISALVGVRAALAHKRAEFVTYSLLASHTLPCATLENATHVSWEFARGLCLRTLIVFCLWLTLICSIWPRRDKAQYKQPKRTSCSGSESHKSTYDRSQASASRNSDKGKETANLRAQSTVILPFAAASIGCDEHERPASILTE